MVVGASQFLHTILAPPPPAAAFVNFTVRIPHVSPCCCCNRVVRYMKR
jgi:hypothetical protein